MPYFNNYAENSNIWCDISQNCELETPKSRIVCGEINILQCGGTDDPNNPCSLAVVNNGMILCDCEDSWNCSPCLSDLPYQNPVIPGDDLYFQFQQIDNLNGQDPNGSFPYGWGDFGFVNGFIKDCCSGDFLTDSFGVPISVINYSSQYFVGVFPVTDYKGDTTWQNIQQIVIDDLLSLQNDLLNQFPDGGGCFYFDWCFNYDDIATRYCLCSEPYKFVKCDDTTILLEGVFPRMDCQRYWYGDGAAMVGNGTPITYRNQYRVKGSLELQSYELAKEFVGTLQKTTTSEMNENWLFRTAHVPVRVARMIANIFAAQEVFANGFSYVVEGEIPKNNDLGTHWFIDAKLKRINCSKTYSCQ